MLKIAFISMSDPRDRRNWSGTLYSEFCELKRYYDVTAYVVKFNPIILTIVRIRERVRYYLTGKTYLSNFSSQMMNRIAAMPINRKLKNGEFDIIFAASGSAILPFIKADQPIIYMSDAVFALMKNYYFFNMNSTVEKNGDLFEKKSIEQASAVVLSSQWSYDGALKYYTSDVGKIHLIPLGANLDIENLPDLERNIGEIIHILFIGVDWKRKGGDIAVRTIQYLNANSALKFELDVIGGKPDKLIDDETIHFHGYINKNSEIEMNLFKTFMEKSSLLLLPTIAECAGIVFCEAAAYSMPVVTYMTGGTATYVRDGYNGKTLDLGSTSIDFAEAILNIVSDGEVYKQYCLNARALYCSDLNWTAWGKRVKKIIEDNCNNIQPKEEV